MTRGARATRAAKGDAAKKISELLTPVSNRSKLTRERSKTTSSKQPSRKHIQPQQAESASIEVADQNVSPDTTPKQVSAPKARKGAKPSKKASMTAANPPVAARSAQSEATDTDSVDLGVPLPASIPLELVTGPQQTITSPPTPRQNLAPSAVTTSKTPAAAQSAKPLADHQASSTPLKLVAHTGSAGMNKEEKDNYWLKSLFIGELKLAFPTITNFPEAGKIAKNTEFDVIPQPVTAKGEGCRVKFGDKQVEFSMLTADPSAAKPEAFEAFYKSVEAYSAATKRLNMLTEYELTVDNLNEIKPILMKLENINITKFNLKGQSIPEEQIEKIKDEIKQQKAHSPGA
ncbi:MAG: hypothetical protein ACHQJ6_07060 [Candidatus Berkiellales bacterium]